MVGFRISPQVLAHTRKHCPQAEGPARIRLKDWQRLAPSLQRELGDTIWSRERHQRRAAHESHEQITLLRTIARIESALQDGPQVLRVTRAQSLVLEDMDIAWSSPLSPQEKLSITSTAAWMKYLGTSLKSCKEELDRQTHNQVRENRRAMDRRAKRAFEDERKGPSKFAGKRAEHRTQDELRC
jgi:hypothetical protein